MDMNDVLGEEHVKRGMEVAAIGNHSMLFIGPPGAGKRMLARRFKTIYDYDYQTILNATNKVMKVNPSILIIAMMTPCPCGNFTDPKKECLCTPRNIQHHLASIPESLMSRIDIQLEVPRLNIEHLTDKRRGESSKEIRTRITQLREKQLLRKPGKMPMEKEAEELAKLATLELGISFASYDKILRVSQTIAMMDGKETIEAHHLSETIGYRSLDRNLW